MGSLIQISQLIAALSFLVIMHELGHFIPAKLFKTKVEKFFLFFDPGFALFKKKIGETTYGIGWLPLGGYVKIAGMVDESMDTKKLAEPPKPYEFRSKPPWQRLIIMLGGVTVNFLLAIIIFTGIYYYYGKPYHAVDRLKQGIMVTPEQQKMGLQDGDIPYAVDGKTYSSLEDMTKAVLFNQGKNITVLRNGNKVDIPIGKNELGYILKNKSTFFTPYMSPNIAEVMKNSAAEKAGLQKGDVITGINNQAINNWYDVTNTIHGHAGKAIDLAIDRNHLPQHIKLTVPKEGMVGIGSDLNALNDLVVDKPYDLQQGAKEGFNTTINSISDQVKSIKILTQVDNGTQYMKGPIGMVGAFTAEWDWHRFWVITGLLSAWLAFLNLLPIPALDGGHVIFTLWEMIKGKPLSQQTLEKAQMVGFVIMASLIVFTFGNDIWNLISNKF